MPAALRVPSLLTRHDTFDQTGYLGQMHQGSARKSEAGFKYLTQRHRNIRIEG